LKETPWDTYACFDFFQTSAHIPDWIYSGENNRKKNEFKEEHIELKICSHIATGFKHFQVKNPSYKSVKKTLYRSGFSKQFSDRFQRPELFLFLDGEANEKFGEKITVLEIARKIFDFRKKYFDENS